MPAVSFAVDDLHHLQGLKLADPNFNISGPVDVLLGVEIFSKILEQDAVPCRIGEPSALCTALGWIVMGKIQDISLAPGHSFCISGEPTLETILTKFWESEEVPTVQSVPLEDSKCEEIFRSSFCRTQAGRYVVSLPFRGDPPIFNGSREVAVRRFYSLERRLLLNPKLAQMYSEFMRDYLKQGHMDVITDSVVTPHCYYVPHHGVVKENSATTKLRVVFDASARDCSNNSLNDSLHIGPKLQRDIVSLLLNFRLHNIVLIADLKQMYRQILISADHCDYQRIVWRFHPSECLQDYRLLTVTYGVASAPYLALRTIQQLATDERARWPLASCILERDMYLDDVVTGCSSLEEAEEIRRQLVGIFQAGGFHLHKWSSNHSQLFASHADSIVFDTGVDGSTKVLGLRWDPHDDVFAFGVGSLVPLCNKRSILSQLARIFDPLGFLTPMTLKVKVLVQYLWTIGSNWDDTAPPEVLKIWEQFQSQFDQFDVLRLPRQIWFCEGRPQLYAFCDASEKGYAAVIYLRHVVDDDVRLSFVIAKGKVAPVKRVSLPRLELCAAHLLSRLVNMVQISLSLEFAPENMFAWSDSMVALAWIRSSPHRWKTYVANRVAQIQESVPPTIWRHVPTNLNPADCASRGLMPADLLQCHHWWNGPAFLLQPQASWPIESSPVSENDFKSIVQMEGKTFALHVNIDISFVGEMLEKWSSLDHILRICAYCFRFSVNCTPGLPRRLGPLRLTELHHVLMVIVGLIQREAFADQIAALVKGTMLPKMFRKLNPFVDKNGRIRVGGRLSQSTIAYHYKHPLLLPGVHRFTSLLIDKYHRDYLHPGLQSLHHLLVQNFWILGARRAIGRRIDACTTCFKLRPRNLQPLMGDLPRLRVSQLKAFECVGVDFGGPFLVTMSKNRGVKSQKAYLCLFVCFSTKALHLELVSDLSTEAFLAALRRFIARRGRCSRIFSDCGTNFVGAARQLSFWMKDAVDEEKIEWSFNPPAAPNFGGLWEAGIKSVKSHLHRVIGEQILTYEELMTVFVQIEALLNSRPLSPLSSDPNDLQPLTPGHFLTLEPVSAMPEPCLMDDESINRLSRWQLLQRLHQDFWRRWHSEYLYTLQQRSKWLDQRDPTIVEGTMVLVKSEGFPPLQWPLGRVVSLHFGQDKIARVASVRLRGGVVKRPLSKLCPLPTERREK